MVVKKQIVGHPDFRASVCIHGIDLSIAIAVAGIGYPAVATKPEKGLPRRIEVTTCGVRKLREASAVNTLHKDLGIVQLRLTNIKKYFTAVGRPSWPQGQSRGTLLSAMNGLPRTVGPRPSSEMANTFVVSLVE